MTICIVSLVQDPNCFVAVSDQRIFYDEAMPSADGMVRKVSYLSDHWNVLFAGDPGRATEVIAEARHLFYRLKGHLTLDAARDAVCTAYQTVRNRHLFNIYVAQHGFRSLEEFHQKAPEMWGAELFAKKLEKIEEFDFDVLLIVFGYEDMSFEVDPLYRFHHIFLVLNPGNAESRDVDGFCAIGTGADAATASITMNRSYGARFLYDAVYLLCEAKFYAEGSTAIGEATNVVVFGPSGGSVWVKEDVVEKLRKIWEEKRANPCPDDAYWVLKDLFNSVDPIPNT